MFAWIKSFFSKPEQSFENVESPYSLLYQASLTISHIQIIQDIMAKYCNSSKNPEDDAIQKAYDDLISISSLDENVRLYLHELMLFTSIRMENVSFYVELAKLIISNYPHLRNYVESQIYWCFDNSADLFIYQSIQQGLLKEETFQNFEKSLKFDMNYYELSDCIYNPAFRYMNFIYLHDDFKRPECLKYSSEIGYIYEENEYILQDPQYKEKMRICLNTEEITAIIRSDNSNLLGFSNIELRPNIIDRNEYVRYGCNLFEYAAFYGSIKCFKTLISNEVLDEEKSAIIKIYPSQSITISDLACCGGNLEICQILLKNGFSFTSQSLKFSIQYHRSEIFEWIINEIKIGMDEECYKASIQYEFIPGIELYQRMKLKKIDITLELSKSGNYILFINLIKINNDPSKQSIDLFLPIFLYNFVDCYRFFFTKINVLKNCRWFDSKFISNNFFAKFSDPFRYSIRRNPFHIAIKHQFMDLMKMILSHCEIDLNTPEKLSTEGGEGTLVVYDSIFLPPLAIAILTDNVEIVEFLLSIRKIDVNQTIFSSGGSNHGRDGKSKKSIIRFAALHGNLEVLEVLLKSKRINKNTINHWHYNTQFKLYDEDIDTSKDIDDENVLSLLRKYGIK